MVMIIIAFIVFFGISRLNNVHHTLEELVSHEQVAMEMLFRMQEAARERSVLLYKITTIKDPFERDELSLQYGRLGSKFGEARGTLISLRLDAEEKRLLAQLAGHVDITQGLQGEVLDQLIVDHFQRAQEMLNKQAVPAQNKILDSITALLDYEIKQSHGSQELLRKQQGQTQLFMVTGGIIAAIFVLLIAQYINRRMGSLISGLATSSQQILEANKRLESLNSAIDHHDIVSIADVQGNITFVNDKFCEVSQYTRAELVGQNHRVLKSGQHPASFFENMWDTISSGKIWQGEVCNRNKSGGSYWVASTIVPFLDETGLPYQYIAVRTDFTSIKEAEQILARGKTELESLVNERTAELLEREEVLRSITIAAQDAVIMIDSKGNVTHWNPAAEKMFGFASDEIIGRHLHSLIVPAKYLEAHNAAFPKFIENGKGPLIGAVTEVEALRRNGAEFPVEISVSAVKIKNSWHAVAIVRDITVRKMAEEQLKLVASTDVLTGICNRRRFNEVFQVELARARRFNTPFTLIIFDIDHFKNINDTYGHPVGDQILLKLALLVSHNVRNTDLFARWGGEEFVVLATNCEISCPFSLAEKLRKLIESYDFSEVDSLTCSFGVTEYLPGDDQESLVKRADSNLYLAKQSGRNCVVCG